MTLRDPITGRFMRQPLYGMEESAATSNDRAANQNPIDPVLNMDFRLPARNHQDQIVDMSNLLDAADENAGSVSGMGEDEHMNVDPANEQQGGADGPYRGLHNRNIQNVGQNHGKNITFVPLLTSTPETSVNRGRGVGTQQQNRSVTSGNNRAEPQVAMDVPVGAGGQSRPQQIATGYNQHFNYYGLPPHLPPHFPPHQQPTNQSTYGKVRNVLSSQQPPVCSQQVWGYPQPMYQQYPNPQQYLPPQLVDQFSNLGLAQQFGQTPGHMQQHQTQQQSVRQPPGFQHPQPQQQQMLANSLSMAFWEKVPDLKGDEGIDQIRSFFKKFDLATSAWDIQLRVDALHSKVSGRAERAFMMARENNPHNFENIREEMLAQLDESDAKQMDSMDSLTRGVRRGVNESVDQLGERIFSMVRRAYSGSPPNLLDEYAIYYLIRSLDNKELALNLELNRKPGMRFDEFVSRAAKAESTQRAVNRMGSENWQQRQFQPQQARPNFVAVQQPRPNFVPVQNQGNFSNRGGSFSCYNCGESGHMSRGCTKPKQTYTPNLQSSSNNGIGNQQQNFAVTGSNRVEVGNRNQHQQNVRNILKQNLLTVEDEHVGNPIVYGIKAAEASEFFNNVGKKVRFESNERGVGKIILLNVCIADANAKAVIDPGAQISLVNANFLKNLVTRQMIDLDDERMAYSKVSQEVFDVNGQKVNCIAAVSLPLNREGFESPVWVRLHVSNANFGYEILLGTNCLHEMGFKLYDAAKERMIDFEQAGRANLVKVLFNTTLKPRATQLVEVEMEHGLDGDFLITPSIVSNFIRADPTLATHNRLVLQIANLSALPMTLSKEEVIGTAEKVNLAGEADDLLASSIIDLASKEVQGNETRWCECDEEGKRDAKRLDMQEGIVGELVAEFHDIFALDDTELTQTDLVRHHIDTGDKKPIRARMRPVPYAFREKVAAMIQDYLGRGIIRPSQSPHASPIVLVPKKDKSLRFCVDYRALNSNTIKDAFPLPNIDNTLLMLGNKNVFSTLDFTSGYWQIKMDDDSIEKTAFITEHGLHEFLVMPFGLCNAVATFQRFMTVLFEGMINSFVFIYIDDILIASESAEQHQQHLRLVFGKVRGAGLKLKISKCKFSAYELPFLGHVLTQNGIKMDADKVKPVLELPLPTTRKELQSFLIFMTYYRKFIFGFGEIASPLFRLLRDGSQMIFGEEEREAFAMLKEKVVKDVMLYFPNFDAARGDPKRQFVIMTDASKLGIAAILCQPDEEGNLRPIYFASRQCSKHEARYCPTELEALAVRFGAKKFAQFISNIPTRILTDHKALVSMFKSKVETGNYRVDKWLMELNARFVLKVEFQPGKGNIIADLLSRSPAFKSSVNFESPEKEEDFAIIGRVMNVQIMEVGNSNWDELKRLEWVEGTQKGGGQNDFDWLEVCDGLTEHKGCKPLLVSALDPIIDGKSELGGMRVLNPIKCLLAVFLLRDGTVKTVASAQLLTKTTLVADNFYELMTYAAARKDFVAASQFPAEQDLQKALASWLEGCEVARKKLEQSGTEQIRAEIPCAVAGLAAAERSGWEEAFGHTAWALERIRAQVILKAERILQAPRVIVGDSTAGQLFRAMERTEMVGAEGGIAGREEDEEEGKVQIQSSIPAIIRMLNRCYISSRVKGVLVVLGKDAIQSGETPDTILDQMRRLMEILEQYGTPVFWAPIPYMHRKSTEHLEVQRRLQRLLANSKIHFAFTSADGRALPEIFRQGNSFYPTIVNHDGWLTEAGVQKMLSWLYTQLPNFPGNLSIGIRTVRSEVVIPNQPMRGLGVPRGQANRQQHGAGLGDRSRPSIYSRIQRGGRRRLSRSRSPVRSSSRRQSGSRR